MKYDTEISVLTEIIEAIKKQYGYNDRLDDALSIINIKVFKVRKCIQDRVNEEPQWTQVPPTEAGWYWLYISNWDDIHPGHWNTKYSYFEVGDYEFRVSDEELVAWCPAICPPEQMNIEGF